MKITVLGCGTSSGVPRIGNDWGACDPDDPRNARTRSSILFESAGRKLLIDCGPEMRCQLLANTVDRIDGVVITHDHADHCHGIDDLRQIAQMNRDQVPLFAREEVLAALQRRFGYMTNGTALYPAVLTTHEIGEGMEWGNAAIRFVDQPHGSIQSLGLRFDEDGKSLGYAIDFHDMTDDMLAMYQGVDVLIADCLRRRPHPTHAHLEAVLDWAAQLKVGQLYLSHLDNSMDYAKLAEELPAWAAPAHDGLEIEFA